MTRSLNGELLAGAARTRSRLLAGETEHSGVIIDDDERMVLTMDAGGTKIAFSAMARGKALFEPICLPSRADDLQACLQTIIDGLTSIRKRLPGAPAAISFAFPGPADYPAGIIGDLPNLPAFRGGVPLGPMLQEHFGIPVFINNDGDLFVYGEAMSGLLPITARALQAAASSRQPSNLFGVTIGTGLGAGLVCREKLYLGDNGAGMEIWSTRSHLNEDGIVEDSVSARAIRRVYAREAGIALQDAPDPQQISAILDGTTPGHRLAASRAFTVLGNSLGECLADAVCLTDSLVVIGGGISLAHRHFLDTAVARMNGDLKTMEGRSVRRMEVTAYNLENAGQRAAFLSEKPRELRVPGAEFTVPFFANKSIGVGVSVLGTNEAVALGAYSYALHALDGSLEQLGHNSRTCGGQ